MSEEKRVGDAVTPSAPKKPYVRKTSKTTIGELGNRLPIGYMDDAGKLHKNFDFKDFKVADERALAKRKTKDMSMAQYVGELVTQLLTKLGPFNLEPEAQKTGEGRFRVSQMYMADVLYMYIRMRMDEIDDKLAMKITCGECEKGFTYSGLLSTTEVVTVDNAADLLWSYDMVKPPVIRGKSITKLGLTMPRWFAIENMDKDTDAQMLRVNTVQGSILSVNGEDDVIAITENEMDEFAKRDLEGIAANIDTNAVGADMSIEGNCPGLKCKAPFKRMIDWNYDNFFAVSSG